MSRGLMYWIIVLIWVILSLANWAGFGGPGLHLAQVSDAVLLILFILLGWNVFGPPVHS